MNFEDYDQYIAQKHRLAVALAIIITKSDTETIDEFINRIKNEIITEEMETNDDVSLNENDFDISDDYMDNDGRNDQIDSSQDSVTILKNFDQNMLGNERADANSLLDVMTQLSHIDENSVNQISTTNTQNNITQSTFFDESQNNLMNITNDPDDNTTFCESFGEGSNKQKELPQNIYLVTTNETFCETNTENNINEAINNVNKEINAQDSKIDSQQTIIYTLQGLTNNTHISQSQEDVFITQKHLLNKHVCQTSSVYYKENSLNNIKPLSNYSYVEENNALAIMYNEQDFGVYTLEKNSISSENKMKTATDCHYSKTNQDKGFENDKQKSFVSSDSMTKIINNGNTIESSQKEFRKTADEYLSVFSENNTFDSTFNNNKNISVQENSIPNNDLNYLTLYQSQDAQSYNIPNDNLDKYRLNSKRSSQTLEIRFPGEESLNPSISYQNENIKHITPPEFNINVSNKNSTEQLNNQNNFLDHSITFDDSITDLINSNKDNEHKVGYNSNSRVNSIQNNFELSLNNLNNLDTNDGKDFRSVEHESKRKELVSHDTNMEKEHIYIDLTNDLDSLNNGKDFRNVEHESRKKEFVSNDTNMEKEHIYIDLTNDMTESKPNEIGDTKEYLSNDKMMLDEDKFSDNATESQAEIVSFKTLEELNKIKCYLSKRERHFSEENSVDSGFRSSQLRSSYNSASQYPEGWINESAHSLLTYLKTCQPSLRTTDITDEISKILGKLVDKLHEQEKYPTFFEELLETVDSLLTYVYEGNNEEFDKIIKKDEAIYRLLLINRSTHIIKYTIDKVVNILENILSDLSDIEITNTDRSENICYIFHILEIILQRIKNTSSQNLQNSQNEEKVLKKSSLTEIWRKKWNLSKNEVFEGSLKKKCVLTKCSEVLNRVIVQAMDGYNLVSFAALQCFNLLQN